MLVIGISGKMGVGKTTLAKHLRDEFEALGYDAAVLSFASLLKKECADEFGFPVEWCYSQEGKDLPVYVSRIKTETEAQKAWASSDPGTIIPTVRQLLQWYGTNYRRVQNRYYWVDRMRERIDEAISDRKGIIIIDDVRFPNEAVMVREYQVPSCVVRVHPYPGWEAGPNADHQSETALDQARHEHHAAPRYGRLKASANALISTLGITHKEG